MTVLLAVPDSFSPQILLLKDARRFVDGQGNIPSTLLFEVQGTPCVLSPTFSGADVFVLMHIVFIGLLVQFSLNLVS